MMGTAVLVMKSLTQYETAGANLLRKSLEDICSLQNCVDSLKLSNMSLIPIIPDPILTSLHDETLFIKWHIKEMHL